MLFEIKLKYFQSSYDRPDPAEGRKRYELELKEQMETKKKIDDEVRELGGGESQSRSHGTVITEKEKGEGGGGEV